MRRRMPSAKQIQEARGDSDMFAEAERRVGLTDEDRLRWVLDFINKDLDRLRAEERVAVGYDLRHFLALGWAIYRRTGPMAEGQLRRIHTNVRKGIRGLLGDQRRVDVLLADESAGWRLPPREVRMVRWSSNEAKRTQFSLLFSAADEADVIVNAIADLVYRAGERLRVCPACETPFLAVKRQEYCSPTCSQRVRNQRKQRDARKSRQ